MIKLDLNDGLRTEMIEQGPFVFRIGGRCFEGQYVGQKDGYRIFIVVNGVFITKEAPIPCGNVHNPVIKERLQETMSAICAGYQMPSLCDPKQIA